VAPLEYFEVKPQCLNTLYSFTYFSVCKLTSSS